MTTFWKPVRQEGPKRDTDTNMKRLGTGLYQLWARCDLCQQSGPLDHFALWERPGDIGTLCFECDLRVEIRRDLEADGWARCL